MFHYEEREHVAVLTIDRPEARNAIDTDTAQQLHDAVLRVEADPAVRVAVITGTPPVFSAGADLKEMQRLRGRERLRPHRLMDVLFLERATPWIAAVDGLALAGGCELVLACDLVVASTRAGFGVPEVKRNLISGAGGLFRMARRIPLNVAMECALTGDPITAERAFTLGLVNELVPDGEALPHALALADRVAANAPLALAEARRLLHESAVLPDADAYARCMEAVDRLMAADDYQEGLAAFVEKRPPRWQGR